ncbi:MAG: DnaD domain protein [Clostridia bacterium]|nr:DnaD domain protein [Clostridia bacterium]
MNLSQNDKSIIFSCTNIPDLFFSEYMLEAESNYVKVYLYILYLSKFGKDIKINDLSKILSIDFPTVQDAIKYWEDKGLLLKKTDGYIVCDIQEISLSKLYSPKLTSSPADALKDAENKQRIKTVDDINTQFFQGVMAPSWYNDIDFWFKKYGFDDTVMLALFGYAHDKRAMTRQYIQATADAWYKNNIKTFDDLEKYFEKRDKRNAINNEISKKLNLYRKLTVYEEDDIIKWTENYGFSLDIIDIALKNASAKNKVRFEYIDSILTDWHNKSLTTVNEVNSYLASFKENKSKPTKKDTFEYTQSTFDNLDSLYDN